MSDMAWGIVTISDNVIRKLAAKSVMETLGVTAFSKGTTDLSNFLKGKSITVKQDNTGLEIQISIIITYGMNLLEVSRNVQSNVKYRLETITGKKCKEVNTIVEGVSLKEK